MPIGFQPLPLKSLRAISQPGCEQEHDLSIALVGKEHAQLAQFRFRQNPSTRQFAQALRRSSLRASGLKNQKRAMVES